jgi:hypothetical protein
VEHLPVETTLYSMSADAPSECENRSDDRFLTLFRVGSIMIEGSKELCLVKNISAGGALIRPYSVLAPGQPVEIELREGHSTKARVSWVRSLDAGLEFDRSVDVVTLLSANAKGPRPRMPRVETSCLAFVREGAILHRVEVQNVSQGGLNVCSANPLTVGGEVMVRLRGMEPRSATVRWSVDQRYGITFNTVLGLGPLVAWLQSQQR